MDERTLYNIVDIILNQAEPHELEVIRAALRRRESGNISDDGSGATLGQNIGRMATDMASKVSQQVGASEESVRNTVRSFVRDMIHREAPELRPEQVEELIDEWVDGKQKRAPKSSADGASAGGLPADVAITMVRQFLAYTTGSMTVVEEKGLQEAMGEWQKKYWERFSPVTRKLIGLHVKGVISQEDFWNGMYDELGLDANGNPAGRPTGPPSSS